jgi:hypothetical protein
MTFSINIVSAICRSPRRRWTALVSSGKLAPPCPTLALHTDLHEVRMRCRVVSHLLEDVGEFLGVFGDIFKEG